jgi:hypothetical protein
MVGPKRQSSVAHLSRTACVPHRWKDISVAPERYRRSLQTNKIAPNIFLAMGSVKKSEPFVVLFEPSIAHQQSVCYKN